MLPLNRNYVVFRRDGEWGMRASGCFTLTSVPAEDASTARPWRAAPLSMTGHDGLYGLIWSGGEHKRRLKGWRRAKKIALIESVNPTWRDLTLDWNN